LITVYVKLMGSLLSYCSPTQPELIEIFIENGSTVQEAIQALGIPTEWVKLILVNHAGAFLNQPLKNGDRVSLFPAEYPVFVDWEGSILRKGHNDEIIKEGEMKKWKCSICDYIYDPVKGDPENGVKPGTDFEAISEDWVCPTCGATKDMFEKE
jgi:rubredoxin/putative ubiquitin-RnfH superfamily antitoxin RatB of RatAB toxin-antitoxin module